MVVDKNVIVLLPNKKILLFVYHEHTPNDIVLHMSHWSII